VAATISPTEGIVSVPPTPVRQVVSPATARAVLEIMVDVVSGRVTQAAVPGYSVGGKTGTSEIPTASGYEEDQTIASFIGFVPLNLPRFVALVKIERPITPLGSDAAAPVFRELALAAIQTLAIPPDRPATVEAAP
jgi:cell division protein FtsI/penicillin-binding protein 2